MRFVAEGTLSKAWLSTLLPHSSEIWRSIHSPAVAVSKNLTPTCKPKTAFFSECIKVACTVAYAEKFHEGLSIQWNMVVICIWCALFVTSQSDVIFMFPDVTI